MLKYNGNSNSKLSQETIANPRNYRKVVDIEELLQWVYQDQAADAVVSKVLGSLGPAMYRSNLLAIQRHISLGMKVDCAGAGSMGNGDIHPDAEAVHDAVCSLKPLWIGLLIQYGKTGARPDWLEGEGPRLVPVLRGNGKPRLEYFDPGTWRKPAYCLLQLDPLPEHIKFVRSVYVEWWDALTQLVEVLELDSHQVSGPKVKREPWL